MEQVKTARIAWLSVDVLKRTLEKLLHSRRFLQQLLPARAQVLPDSISFLALLGVTAAVLRQRAQLLNHLCKFAQIGGRGFVVTFRQRTKSFEDQWQRLRIERKVMVVILDYQCACAILVLDS